MKSTTAPKDSLVYTITTVHDLPYDLEKPWGISYLLRADTEEEAIEIAKQLTEETGKRHVVQKRERLTVWDSNEVGK